MKWTIIQTTEFKEWFETLDFKTQTVIRGRLSRIESEGHFGFVNRFEGLTELKWPTGLRVYSVEEKPKLIVLLGGNKNGQSKDIREAKKIRNRIK